MFKKRETALTTKQPPNYPPLLSIFCENKRGSQPLPFFPLEKKGPSKKTQIIFRFRQNEWGHVGRELGS